MVVNSRDVVRIKFGVNRNSCTPQSATIHIAIVGNNKNQQLLINHALNLDHITIRTIFIV